MHINKSDLFKNLLRIPFIFLIIATALLLSSKSPAYADGMVMEVNPYNNGFGYYDEESQNAIISWENGMEKMILVIGTDEAGTSGLVWIFPVPSEPDRIVLDIIEDVPTLYGLEISQMAQSSLDESWYSMEATQLYTIPFISWTGIRRPHYGGGLGYTTNAGDGSQAQEVTVYEHIEKEGITSELITARTAEGLEFYLGDKGLNVSATAIPVLNNYIGQDYSFVVSWISPSNYANNRQNTTIQRGVYVTFPTDEIYFPLLPTSVYDSKVVPASIWVIGHVTPRLFGDVGNYVTTEYFINGSLFPPYGYQKFYTGDTDDISYTKIDINAPSKYLTDDLWMTRGLPSEKRFTMFVATEFLFLTIVLFIIASIAAGIFAGMIAFRKQNVKVRTLALIGLSNCLTLLGPVLVTLLIRIESVREDAREVIDKLRVNGYVSRRTVATILFTYSIPFLIYGSIFIPFNDNYAYFELKEVFFIYLIPVTAFMSALFLMRVDREDRILFRELKQKNISSWLFQTFGGSKIAFIVMFSAFYLAISWLLINLVRQFV